MKYEEIHSMWSIDSEIDKTEISRESVKIPKLHHKYYGILVQERIILRQLESSMKTLKLEKYEFLTQGHNEETRQKGWVIPAKGLILKADIPMYMEADPDIINLSLKIGIQQEKVEYIESIMKTITNRSYILRTILDFEKFIAGA